MATEAARSDVGVGTVVANTYEIVRLLGRGGMGAVWEAHHTRLPGRRVAIKVLHASVAADPETLARFRREAEIACRLGHPNIVEVHDFNNLEGGSPYLILELLEGESLDERIKKGPISSEECDSFLRQMGSALQCAHSQGVIHRDLKPQNVFLVPSPTGEGSPVVKILDFGISKIRGSQTVKTQDSTLLGTPQYMAPEQAIGQHANVDARTDIFAVGAILYEILSGTPPFSGQNIPEVVYKVVHVDETPIAELVPSISTEKAAALHKALAKSQEDRFETIDALVEAFTGRALPANRPTSVDKIATDSARASIAAAETLDSSKIDMAKAATVASHSREMPTVQPSPDDLGEAATIDSSKLDKGAIAMTGSEPSAGDDPSTIETRTNRGPMLIAGLTIAAAAIAAFALTRGDEARSTGGESSIARQAPPAGAPAQATPRSAAAVPPDAAPVAVSSNDATVVAANPFDAGLPDASAAVVVSNGKGIAKKTRPEPPVDEPETDEALPEEVKRLLADAKRHLEAGNLAKALHAAQTANKKKITTRAYILQARIHCRVGDIGSFQQVLRKLPPRRAKRAEAACTRWKQ